MVRVVMARMVMVPASGERRGGKDHQQQGGSKNLLHGRTLAPSRLR
jgi:hypothetical protein